MQKERCFYVRGNHTLIDTATEDGRGSCTGETLAEVQKRYPGAELIPLDEAVDLVTAANDIRYKVGVPEKIDEDTFNHMLEVLPPVRWEHSKGAESFEMSELECGCITACYVRVGAEYFRIYHHVGTLHAELVECCRGA